MALLGSYIDDRRKAAWNYLQSWQSTVYSMVVLGATMVVIFWASVFLYISFYFTFMPQESVTWPIHFQYRSCVEQPGLCSNPTAMVGVTDPVRGTVLVGGQQYRVVVDMDMPESLTNQKIGMFLLSMEMRSQDGEAMQRSSRSTMLRYKSPLLHTISTAVFAPFLLYGWQEEKQTVTVELFSQYEENPVTPLWEIGVEVASRHVEFYGATLRIHATFTGLRYLMYHYPMMAASIGIGICMIFLSTVVILSWYQFSEPTLMSQPQVRSSVSPATTTSTSTNTKIEKVTMKQTDPPSITAPTLPGLSTTVTKTSKGKESEADPRRGSEEGKDDQGDEDSSRSSEGDSFEVVAPSKLQRAARVVGRQGLEAEEGEEEDLNEEDMVVRHRVQSVST
ncbi:hypothetical protein Pcinc_016344 [Petrolisthes cinctipes]|uniref:Seipin n=1 Tax=Petrolisthes cinctipes TaxID=88211 RepID=A0AAE1FT06_PETCI|nr:hypothetical protein Pcinc_016344 [Petrolisthes cinctipes]